ncbi:MAG: hypothetical protein U0625_00115 [Phycisphaerales bacterium]
MGLRDFMRRLLGRPTPRRENPFLGLRAKALGVTREEISLPAPTPPEAAWGAIVELHMGTEVVMVTFSDGTASLYFGYGGGVIGGGGHDSVRAVGAELLAECERLRPLMVPAQDDGPPPKGRFRIWLRTDAGLLRAEVEMKGQAAADPRFREAFHLGQKFFASLTWGLDRGPRVEASADPPRSTTSGVMPLCTLTVLALAMLGLGVATIIATAGSAYLMIASELTVIAAVLVAVWWAHDIAGLVEVSALARIAFGIDTLLLAGTMSGGIVAYVLAWSSLSDLGVWGCLVIGAIALGAGCIAVHGLLVAAGWAPSRPLIAILRALRTNRRTDALGVRDLSPAGCLIAILTALVIFGGGIPLTWWMYDGKAPGWIPNIVLALPIMALALAFFGVCVFAVRRLGVRVLRRK